MSPDPLSRCPHCDAPRVDGPECPRCGVIYAKARPRVAAASPVPDPPLVLEPTAGDPRAPPDGVGDARGLPWPGQAPARWSGGVGDARAELVVRAVAPPAALLLALALVATSPGQPLVRTFLSMWVHELGHAVTAWLCGYGSFPGPWRTWISSSRSAVVVLGVAAAFGWLAWRGWRTRRRALLAAGGIGLAAQLVCTLLPARAAQALFSFGGDGGAMVLGAALVATIWTDREGALGRGGLRWGFLAIGACGLVDPLRTWILAWGDHDRIPLGEIEGVGLSDASKLWQVHGWSLGAITGRYAALGMGCLIALAIGYSLGVARARERLRAAQAESTADRHGP